MLNTQSAELRHIATRCIWFETPEQAMDIPERFAAYVLTYGLAEDAHILRQALGDENLRHALRNAPPGIFDLRSWHYWHLMLDMGKAPPLPQRFIESTDLERT
jgi:hypothetical protein